MGGNGLLFERLPRLPDSKLHPLFLQVRDSRGHIAARGLMDRVFSEYVDKDGNFVRDFQTQGFSARVWELSLFAYLFEEGYTLDSEHAMPDFVIADGCAIEAVTNQPRNPMSAPESDLQTEEELRLHFTINSSARISEFQNQLRKAITSKMRKRFSDGRAYWELPHVRDLPFVVAIQSFYAETSTAFTDAVAAAYLLGEQTGSGGLFDDPELTPLSAVLFSNSGTVGQFNRIGKQFGYGVEDVMILRYGVCYDPTPGAVAARQFGYEVGTPGSPREDFAQSLHVIHNPNADRPLPQATLIGVRQTARIQGRSESVVPGLNTFLPFASKTLVMEAI
ncbi:MAG: hypothetical protein ACLPQY_19995 [Streptosporangiaceae bacterium]